MIRRQFDKNPILYWTIVFTTIMVMIMFFSRAYSTYPHGDELYSMGIANNTSGYWGYSEERYYERCGVGGWLAEDFADYLEVLPGDSFDIESIWINNAGDVHPPLFYLLLHTLCFVFKGSQSKWICGVINILMFAIMVTVLACWTQEIVSKKGIRYRNTFTFFMGALLITMPAVYDTIRYVRMYAMLMTETILMAYFLYRILCARKVNCKYMIMLYFAIVFGGLTHYYFYFYSFFAALFVGICLLLWKLDWKQIGVYVATWILGISTNFLIFPAAINHMFFGYRSKDMQKGFNSDYTRFVRFFIEYFDWTGLKYILPLLLIGIVIMIVGWRKCVHDKEFWIISLSFVVATLLLMKLAPWDSFYYICPMYPMTALAIITWGGDVCSASTRKALFLGIVIVAINMVNIFHNSWQPTYLYARNWEEAMQPIKELGKVDCYYIQEQEEWQQILWGKIGELAEYDEVCVQREPRFDFDYMNLVMGDRVTKDPVIVMTREAFVEKHPELQTDKFVRLSGWSGWTYLLYEGM